MSQVYMCKHCLKVIGEEDGFAFIGDGLIETENSNPNGKCNHTPEKKYKIKRFFGLLEYNQTFYPETKTCSSYYSYNGPKSKILLLICMKKLNLRSISTKSGLIHNDGLKLFGEGLKYFSK